jgi:superfamily II DNA helicase RecQ
MKRTMLALVAALVALNGCTMFRSWKSIPPPGGCDQCHTAAISANWQVAYKAATVADERGRQSFQTPEYNVVQQGNLTSPIEEKKLQELRCFECHKSPNPEHRGRMGRFHH